MKFLLWLKMIGLLIADWYGIKVSAPTVMIFKLAKSLLWMRFRKHAPHDWRKPTFQERKRKGLYGVCKRCGAKR
jgi:hypothetical protein